MLYIKNDEELLSHGNVYLRRAAIDIIDHGIKNADPYVQVKKLVHVDGRTLHVGNDSFDLNHYTRIYVLGAGKATFPIAKALDDVLGELITDGVVICKYGQEGELKHQRLYHSSHPIPDENGYEACKELMKIARQTVDTDIVFSIATGGSTSLMPYPVDGVTIQEKRQTGLALLRSGANMWEMNYVRKHLTQAKAGFLAKAIAPGTPILNIGVSDGIGQGVDLCVEPSCPDDSTFADAQNVLTKYHLWDKVPENVANYIKNGTPEQETPKDLSDRNNCGLMEGNTSRENAELFPEAVAEMHEHPESFRAPEGESTTELQERSVHAFRRIVADNPGRTVAVVSHGFVIWAYLSYIRGLPLKNMGKDVVANASVTCLKYKNADNMPEIIYLNDDSHIPTDNKFNVSQSFCAP